MRHEHLGPDFGRDEPISREWNIPHVRQLFPLSFLPALEVNRSGKRCQHHELGERQIGLLCYLKSCVERVLSIGRQSENEGSQDMHSVRTKGLQLTNEIFSRLIKVLINRLQSFWSHRLDSDQRSFNIGPFHRHEE